VIPAAAGTLAVVELEERRFARGELMSDDLEALAARGQQAPTDPKPTGHKVDPIATRRYLAERSIADTFRQVHGSRVPAAVFVTATIVLGIVLFATRLLPLPITFGVIVVGVVLSLVVNKKLEKRAIEAGIAWVEGVPFELNRQDYLQALSEQRMNTTVELQLTFRDFLSEPDRELFGNACAGAVEVASRTGKGNILTLRSHELSTYYPAQNGNDSYSTSALPHRWVVTVVDRAIRSIHQRQPLARVRVQLD
jgi:hypothetical protein